MGKCGRQRAGGPFSSDRSQPISDR